MKWFNPDPRPDYLIEMGADQQVIEGCFLYGSSKKAILKMSETMGGMVRNCTIIGAIPPDIWQTEIDRLTAENQRLRDEVKTLNAILS